MILCNIYTLFMSYFFLLSFFTKCYFLFFNSLTYPNHVHALRVCVCVCVCVCGHVYVVYEDTNLYNDMGMTQVLQGEGDL